MITTETFQTAALVKPTTANRRCALRIDPFEGRRRLIVKDSASVGLSSSSLFASVPTTPSLLLASSSSSDQIDTTMFLLPDNPLGSPLAVVILALALLVAAQTFINNMLEGDRGLGAFLSDGTGYNRSGYRPNTRSNEDKEDDDPLPWLKLPRLDFVEVAGQAAEDAQRKQQLAQAEQERVYQELDVLRDELNRELQTVRRNRLEGINAPDDMKEAKRLEAKLEGLMRAYGIDYETDE